MATHFSLPILANILSKEDFYGILFLGVDLSSSSSFSSLVDEVFEHNLSSSTTENQLLPPHSLASNHLNSYQVGAEGVSGTVCPPELDGNFMHSDINFSEVKPGCTNAISSSGTAQISFMSSCKSGHDFSSLRFPGGHNIVHGGESLQPVSSDGQGVLGNITTMQFGGSSRKRYLSEFLLNIPSLQQSRTSDGPRKRRKAPEHMKDDSHITFDDDGVVLTYHTVEADSIRRLVSDLQRLSNAHAFSCRMRRLIGVKVDDKRDEKVTSVEINARKGSRHRLSQQMRKTFRIEAIGLMSLWFSYVAVPMVHFVVEWKAGDGGCFIHVSPDQLWPHTKTNFQSRLQPSCGENTSAAAFLSSATMFLEDFVNVGEVASFLDSVRLTAGPLLALSSAIRPTKMPVTLPAGYSSVPKQNSYQSEGATANDSSTTAQNISAPLSPAVAHSNKYNLQSSALSIAGRGGPGLVPSPSLPFDVTVVLRGPYWIRVIYRKIFSFDIRCFSGDQGLNAFEPSVMSARHSGVQLKASINKASGGQQSALALNHFHGAHGIATSGPTTNIGNQVAPTFIRAGSAVVNSSKYASGNAGAPPHPSPGTNLPVHMRSELSSTFTALGDYGGYGGAWVPLAALKKVLRGILKYLGVLWLFSQFPELLKEILGSVLNENEGALLNLDQEQPALRFFVGRVVCEPYDASRVASFITLLTLPIPVMREFISLLAWKKSQSQVHGEIASAYRVQVELCLEMHHGSVSNDHAESSSSSKSNIKHDRANRSVDFGLTFVLDHALKHNSSVGGAAWLPYCMSVRLRYTFGDNCHVACLTMEGSHGGKSFWLKDEDWENCKQMVARTVETANGSPAIGETGNGRLRLVAKMIHKQLQLSLHQLRDGPLSAG
ncbi:unnamed protein product [Miscanthus lutarioriparius]|uniref:Uncharacterized protein n=1 Tax=Miscanthus lutarioriparius TaxID=422564 RepID=A0A811R6I8_9POAL|nr:unnamed protein product [Miscanthus lutarioriparius]